jgi:hypothetical protein
MKGIGFTPDRGIDRAFGNFSGELRQAFGKTEGGLGFGES